MSKHTCANCYYWNNEYAERVGGVQSWRLVEECYAEGLCVLREENTSAYDDCENWKGVE